MPELPEVEVTRIGLQPYLEGQVVARVIVRNPHLRQPVPETLSALLEGQLIGRLLRRGKYILVEVLAGEHGWLILHLGMSGSWRVVPSGDAWKKHDHVALEVNGYSIRFHDPRRFGLVLWYDRPNYAEHPLIAVMGQEPLEPEFDGRWLHTRCGLRRIPIKPLLMDSHVLVGVGNIYAAESLFKAGISPKRLACRVGAERYQRLAEAIRETLSASIAAGGSTLRDYLHSDGGAGSFQIQCQVYDRAGEPCFRCGRRIEQIRQAGRSTFYCPGCQH